MIQELYLRNIMVMKSQGFEVYNRPMPRVIYNSDRNCYRPFWNTIILYKGSALVHELVHSLQPDYLFHKHSGKYISYKEDYRLYIEQKCEKQAYAIEDFLKSENGSLHASWNILPKHVGRKMKLKINRMIKEYKRICSVLFCE